MTPLLALIEKLPVASLLVAVGFVIVAVVGGVVTVTNPKELSFSEYATLVTGMSGAAGLLGIGRGAAAKKTQIIDATPAAVRALGDAATKPSP